MLPTKSVADKFNAIVSPIFADIQNRRDIIHNVAMARDRLLPKLMNGEIEV